MEREKGYYIKQSFSNDFVDYMEELYKKYGESIFEIQGIANKYMDIAQFSREFFGNSSNVADVSVDANANVREKNVTQYTFENNKATMRLNSLYMMYKKIKEIYSIQDARIALEKVISGEIFVNDLHTYASMSYCYAFDLRTLITEGMNFYHGNMKIGAPKRSDSFIALLIQSTAYISNQIAGASSYPDLFVVLDWFYRKELGEDYVAVLRTQKNIKDGNRETWLKVKNQMQNLIYSLNFPFRGGQSAFTNVSVMDKGFMKSLFNDYTLPDFTKPNINSTIELSKIFFEYFTEINCKEGVFTFPVTTLAISLDDNNEYIDPKFADWAAKANSEKSLANVFQDVPTSFSSCCRLRNDFSKMGDAGYQNSFGVGGLSIGSHRVSGPNLPRLAILEKDNPNIVEEDLEITHKILFAHRELIKERIAGGFLPLYTSGWIDLERQYSTIGFVGGYEYVVNKGLKIENKNGQEALQKVLRKVEDKVSKWQDNEKIEYVLNGRAHLGDRKIWISQAYKDTVEISISDFFNKEDFMEYQFALDAASPFVAVKTFAKNKINNIYNCEQIPAESMAVRLAEIDKILGYNENYLLYSNQYIPLISDASIYDRFKIQGKFDSLTSGGAILHINVDDEKPISPEQFKALMNCARMLKTKYYAINYAYSECADGHYIVGKHDTCPICEKNIIQQYTRVVGFITPVKSWNGTRRKFEYPNRVFYHNGSLDIEKQIEK